MRVTSPVFVELVGTFVLIVLGDGVVAGVLLKGSKSENAGWLAITRGLGLRGVCGPQPRSFPRASPTGPVAGLGPYLVGSLVWGIGLSLGGTTGYAINPARDLGPRLAHALLPISGKRDSDWAYAPIPVIGPVVGGGLAELFARLAGL